MSKGTPRPAAAGALDRHRAAARMHAPRTARGLILLLAALLAGSVAWAGRTELRELVRAEGEIVPSGRLVAVEHFDGGLVEEVLVAHGDRVGADQVMARLSSPELGRVEAELRKERALLARKQAGLGALLDDAAEIPPDAAFAMARRDLHHARLRILRDRAASRAAALELAEEALAVVTERVRLAEEDVRRAEALFDRGLVAKSAMTARQDVLQGIRGDLFAAKTVVSRALGEATDARLAVDEAELAFRQEIERELLDVADGIERVEARKADAREQRRRLTVRSPVAGLVQSAIPPTPGEVIAPGERIFEILPTGASLVAEVRLRPVDIAQVRAGDPVSLKPTAYDARRYGTLSGRIATISPTTLLDTEGQPYFSAEVALDDTVIGSGPFTGEVGPGMVVMAEMQTGRRTVLDYLLKPIAQSLQMSMTER
jgi:HlyD family secretion protein/adhesin transport system membrane fusion protein